jgi:hypothetical protein
MTPTELRRLCEIGFFPYAWEITSPQTRKLLTAAREWLPRLLAEVARLENRIAELEAERDEMARRTSRPSANWCRSTRRSCSIG